MLNSNQKTRLPKIIQIHYPSQYLQTRSNDFESEQNVTKMATKAIVACKKLIGPRKYQHAKINSKPVSNVVGRITCPARRMFYEQNQNKPMAAKKTVSAEPNSVYRYSRNTSSLLKSSNVEQGDREVRMSKKIAPRDFLNQIVVGPHLKYGVFSRNRVASTRVQPRSKCTKPLSPQRSTPLNPIMASPRKRRMSPIRKGQTNYRSIYAFRTKTKRNRIHNLAQSEIMHLDIRPMRGGAISPSRVQSPTSTCYNKLTLPLHKSTSPTIRATRPFRHGLISPISYCNLSPAPSVRVSTSYYNVSSFMSNSIIAPRRTMAHRRL